MAPADAASTGLDGSIVDYHISTTVLEHIPEDNIKAIMVEAKRLLKCDGVALHFIDLSDHFQHQDSSISKINFLRYSDTEWMRIANNEFAYCNRMRASEFLRLFSELTYRTIRVESVTDKDSKDLLGNGFYVDPQFNSNSGDICTTLLKVMMHCV